MTEGYQYSREGYLNENFRLFHLKDSAGQERDFHFHDFDKIVILISGRVDYTVEGATYKLEPGDVLLVRHHMIHRASIDMTVPYERVIIYLDSGYVDRFAPDGGLMECFAAAESRGYCLLRPDDGEGRLLEERLKQLETAASDEGFGAEILRGAALTQLMVLLNRMMQHDKNPEAPAPEYNEKIASALSYINENISKNLTVDELAGMTYLSKYHFMRLFKAQTGSTVHGYISRKRLNLAARLLREGVPAVRAAAECGFSDYSSFHRAFTKAFGVSPGKIKGN